MISFVLFLVLIAVCGMLSLVINDLIKLWRGDDLDV